MGNNQVLHSQRNLHIFYRHVHQKADKLSRDPNKRRPDWFSHEVCFRNLLHTVWHDPQAEKVKIIVIYDGSQEDFADDFISGYCANEPIGIGSQLIRGGSDINSFLITLGLVQATVISRSGLIYFLENDYMHQVGWVSKVFELYDSGVNFDYLSLYDHQDKYYYPMYPDLISKIFISRTHHWRTAPSTCASFIVDKSVFESDFDILSSGLTDYYLFNKLVSERDRVLLTPVPGLATHSMESLLSPTVEWEKLVF